MTNTQHTPGPWNYLIDPNDGRISAGTIIANNTHIARINNINKDADGLMSIHEQAEVLANARLIAAAPETAAELERRKAQVAELVEALEKLSTAASEATALRQAGLYVPTAVLLNIYEADTAARAAIKKVKC